METESFLSEVRRKYRDLRPSEQKAAELILEKEGDILDWTLEQFAQTAGISQPTVIRFTNAVGLKGYKELKRKILEETCVRKRRFPVADVLDYPISREDQMMDIPAKVIQTNIRLLESARESISNYDFIKAVYALEQAEHISVFAMENSSCTAEDFVTKMTYIGKSAYFNKDGYMQQVNAKNLTSSDVAVGISHTGKSKMTVKALAYAKKAGAVTIAITNFEGAVIDQYADIILRTDSRQYQYGNAIFSRCAQISMVDMLFLGVFLKNYDENLRRLNNSWENTQDLIYEKEDFES